MAASPTFEQHLVDLKEVLTRLESAGLSVKLENASSAESELQCHPRTVSGQMRTK